jgi:hypothetical protein
VDAKGGTILIVDAEDEAMLAKIHEVVLSITKAEATVRGDADRIKSETYAGATVWTLQKDEAHAILGKRLLLSNRMDTLKAVLDLRKSGAQGLVSSPAYQAARKAAGPGVASAFVNLAVVKRNPGVEKGLAEGRSNPLGALLFAGILESLRQSDWLALGVRIDGDRLALELVGDGKLDTKEGIASFTVPGTPEGGVLPSLDVPRRIAAISLYRDLHGFYAAKDKLFPERTSGLIFFENMMGIFFSGRDLTEEVFAEMKPEIRFVVAEQKFDPKVGIPQVQLPAFAVVFQVRNPKEFGEVVEEAWQKAVGLVSFTSGQKGQPGLIVDRPTHGDTRYTVAYYSTSGIKDRTKLPMQHNFRPALARVGDCVVLSSTEGLATDLIDSLKKEAAASPKAMAGVHSLAEIDTTRVVPMFQANREAMVRQSMVEKGLKQEEAEAQFDALVAVVRALGKARLNLFQRDGQSHATFEWQLNVK